MAEKLINKWQKVNFNSFFEVLPSKKYQVQKQDYLSNGDIPVVDQGQSLIAGYTNDKNKIFNHDKVIIFGDHTRIVKYIDFEFAVGADGTQILGVKQNINLKFAYYQLLNKKIPDTGYNRHFKYVKAEDYYIPPTLEEQQEIVDVLDAASEIIRLRTACIESAQSLIPALFQEMFGDLDCNNSYKKVLFGDIITVLTDYHANGSYEKLKEHVTLLDNPDYALMVRTTDLEKNNFIDNVKYISQSAYEFLEKSKIYGGEIIINKIGSAGNVYLMPKLNRPVSLGMNAFLIRIDEKCANNIFIYNLLTSSYGKKIIQEKVSGAVTKTITKNSIRSLKLYLPPVEQQELFAEKVQEIEAYIKTQQAELENAKTMFQSLLHHSFTGELTRRAYGE